jgi:hypothetical protein
MGNNGKLRIIIASLLVTCLLLSLMYDLRCQASASVIRFDNIMAEIQPLSPSYNESYTGNIPLDVTVHLSAKSQTNSSLIPYQEIVCQYQVDNGNWINVTLVGASKQKVFYDPTFQGFWNQIDCNYNGSLQELSNGKHSLNITLTPFLDYSYLVLSNGTLPLVRIGDGYYNALMNSTVDFYVYGNYDTQTTTQNQGVPPFPTILVVIASAVAIAVLAVSLLLVKRHRKTISQKDPNV